MSHLKDVQGFLAQTDRKRVCRCKWQEVSTGVKTGWGDAETHCAIQKKMEGEERLAGNNVPCLFLACISHKYHHLQSLFFPFQLHQDCLAGLGVTSPWGNSYIVTVHWAPCMGNPVLPFLNLGSGKILCLPPFPLFAQDTQLGFDRTSL